LQSFLNTMICLYIRILHLVRLHFSINGISKSVKLFNAEITISIASHHLTTLVYYLKNSKNWLIQNFKIRKLSGNVININLNINIHGASSTLEYCYNLPKRHCSQQIISGTPPWWFTKSHFIWGAHWILIYRWGVYDTKCYRQVILDRLAHTCTLLKKHRIMER